MLIKAWYFREIKRICFPFYSVVHSVLWSFSDVRVFSSNRPREMFCLFVYFLGFFLSHELIVFPFNVFDILCYSKETLICDDFHVRLYITVKQTHFALLIKYQTLCTNTVTGMLSTVKEGQACIALWMLVGMPCSVPTQWHVLDSEFIDVILCTVWIYSKHALYCKCIAGITALWMRSRHALYCKFIAYIIALWMISSHALRSECIADIIALWMYNHIFCTVGV